MAITRAQQAKQMLQDGGMSLQDAKDIAPKGEFLAYINRKEADMLKKAGGSGAMTKTGIPSFTSDTGPGGGATDTGAGHTGDTAGPGGQGRGRDLDFQQRGMSKADYATAGDRGQNFGGRGRIQRAIDFIMAGPPRGFNPATRDGAGLMPRNQMPLWMQLGYSSEEEYNTAMGRGAATTSEPPVDLNRIAYRLMADGGAVIDDEPRQAYGLGSIVKKATRAVKKVVKSDIGKAAIIGAGIYGLGGGFGAGFKMSNIPGFTAAKNFIIGKPLGFKTAGDAVARSGGLLDLIGGKVGAGIIGTSLLAGLLTAKQEEEAQELSRGEGIDIDAARRSILARAQGNIPSDFRATAFRAEGSPKEGEKGIMKMASAPDPIDALNDMAQMLFGKNLDQLTSEEYDELQDAARDAMAEGGKPEPVAKKTMPLLDMGGKEMDLRDNGGFVPIGRMEKADDVPARLSKNEFVFTADAVRNAGEGDVDKGAEVMYNMMKNLEAGGDVSKESQGLEGARKMFQTSQRLEEVL